MSTQSNITISIEVDGAELYKEHSYKSIFIEKKIGKICSATIEIEDGDPSKATFEVCDKNAFRCGGEVTIKAGYDDEKEKIFSGKIIATSISMNSNGESLLTVTCKSITYKTSLRRKSKYFENILDSDTFRQILSEYSEITKEIDPTDILHESLVQQNITDWDFINLRAEANGYIVISDDEFLKIKKIETDRVPDQKIEFGRDIISMNLTQNSRDQLSSVDGKTWNTEDLAIAKTHNETSTVKSFGEDNSRELAETTSNEKGDLVDSGCLEREELNKCGEAYLDFSKISKILGTLTLVGKNIFKVGKTVEIIRGSRFFEGVAYISGVSHSLTKGTWQTTINVGIPYEKYYTKYNNISSPPALGNIGPVSGLSVGVIKRVADDPKRLHRFFVHIPSIHNEAEGLWCRYLTLAAKERSGVQFFPDIESEVVVGFFNDDPRQGIILGAMFGRIHSPPKDITNENFQKAIVTTERLELSFDDETKKISVIVPGEEEMSVVLSQTEKSLIMKKGLLDFIKIGETGIEIVSSKDIRLSAEGSIKVSGKLSANIESLGETSMRGVNTRIHGDAEAELIGAGRVSLRADGETVIRGAIVRIN